MCPPYVNAISITLKGGVFIRKNLSGEEIGANFYTNLIIFTPLVPPVYLLSPGVFYILVLNPL